MTTAPVVDGRLHDAAVKAAVTAQLGEWDAFGFDEVPGSDRNANEALRNAAVPDLFAIVAVERRYTPPRRQTSQVGRSSWRVTVLCSGRTVREALWVQARAALGLDEVVLTVGGSVSTPLQHESSTTPEWDDGRYSCLSRFTYTC